MTKENVMIVKRIMEKIDEIRDEVNKLHDVENT